MTLIAESIKSLVDKKNQVKMLEKEIRELQNQLIAEHQRRGNDLIVENGYQSKMSHGCRKSPIVPAIEALLGREIPEECYRMTPYDMIRTEFIGDKILNESSESGN